MSAGRIAIVFPLTLRPEHRGKDLLLIPEGIARLGFDVELHCPAAEGDDWPLPVHAVGSERLLDQEYWRSRDLAGAVVFAFLRFSRLMGALKACGVPVVAKSDTTGHVIARVHPRETFAYAMYDRSAPLERAHLLLAWLARVGPMHRREADELVRAVATADRTVVETEPARTAVAQVLERRNAGTLAERITVVPNPIARAFLTTDVATPREDVIVAIGRWDLAVKDAPLLAGALERFLASHPEYRAVIVGRDAAARFPQAGGRITTAGRLPQPEIAALLSTSKIVASSSRWESFSLSAHEGLASGCSVAGPALGPMLDIAARGPYGTVAARRTHVELAHALEVEAAAWRRGDRDPVSIATFWREHLTIDGIAARFIALLGADQAP